MKKWILGFITLFLASSTLAQNFEFETIRTEESPGFFALRLFPTPNTSPIEIQDIFVKNYDKKNEKKYEDLLIVLGEFGAKIIEPKELLDYEFQSRNRFIFLGKGQDDHLNFQASSAKTALDEFEDFATENLGIVFYENVKLDFGGNISEVYPPKIDYWGTEPVLIVGKFEKPMRTLTQISAISSEGEVVATSIIDLREFFPDPMAVDIPDIWEKMSAPEKTTKEPTWITFFWMSIFPWILGLIGVIIFFLYLLSKFLRYKAKKSDDEPFLVQNLSETNFQELEKNLPFEVEKRGENTGQKH